MKKQAAEQVYEDLISALTTTEKLWLVHKILGELRRSNQRRGAASWGTEPMPGGLSDLVGLLGRPERSLTIEEMDAAVRCHFQASTDD